MTDYPGVCVFPIQIREDMHVMLSPVPFDLSQAEADKICRVVQALVQKDALRARGEK